MFTTVQLDYHMHKTPQNINHRCVYGMTIAECWKFPVLVFLANEPNFMVCIYLIYILINIDVSCESPILWPYFNVKVVL